MIDKEFIDFTAEQRESLRRRNNPNNEPVGPYTGRCSRCHSNDLWDDATVYGCNCCGAFYSN